MHKRSTPLRILVYVVLTMMLPLLISSHASGSVRAYLNYVLFQSPGQGPYIETYMSIDGSSVNFRETAEGQFQAEVEVTMVFRQGEEIIEFDKYVLRSEEIPGENKDQLHILDQQRYFLPAGTYEFEISLKDVLSDGEPFTTLQKVDVTFVDEEINLSGIQLADSVSKTLDANILSKSGYDILPKVHNYYPENESELTFYTEIYNTQKVYGEEGRFLVRCMISTFESEQILDEYVSQKVYQSKEVIPYLNEFDISDLPTGNYILGIEVRDSNNDLLASNAVFFLRNNPGSEFSIDKLDYFGIAQTFASKITSEDTLNEYLRSMVPRASQMEQKFIFEYLGKNDLQAKQRFFYYFWYTRNRENPQLEWNKYQELVAVVNERYSTQIAKGYDTDRGRVYLKYGPPNILTESYNEPSSYPYEIWHYYELGKRQRNKKFVFYTHDIITNDFWLLHSDAIGEVSNYRWQLILNQRWYDPYNIDATQPPDIWGSKASDYYRNPR